MAESFGDAVKALRHVARGNGMIVRIADRIVAAHERDLAALVAMREPVSISGDSGQKTVSERPITQGLRSELAGYEPTHIGTRSEVMVVDGDGYRRMVQLCDDVDAVHANLEDRHAELAFKYETITDALTRIGQVIKSDDGRA